MMPKLLHILLSCCLLLVAAPAMLSQKPAKATPAKQQDPWEGQWKGIITQTLGPSIRYFDMELSVAPKQKGAEKYEISGHYSDGPYHAYIVGHGTIINSKTFQVTETEIVRADTIPGMAWCLKDFQLTRSMEKGDLHLRGDWRGETYFGACPPGKIDLVRQILRP